MSYEKKFCMQFNAAEI